MNNKFLKTLAILGPGFAVAATGVGAGDMVAASVAGAKLGTVILWAVVVGAVVKYALNEGIARWQLATGTTLLEGWTRRLGKGVSAVFVVYLVLWSFIVAGAMMAACGLAGNAIVPALSVTEWGIIHSLVALAIVLYGRYALFEKLMKIFIALMFVDVLVCAFMIAPNWVDVGRGILYPELPALSGRYILAILGGVGGSVTLLSYGYWIREKGWTGTENRRKVGLDLGSAYFLTGLFSLAVVIIAAGVHPEEATGTKMVLQVANGMGATVGPAGKWIFLFGFWGAVFTSMIGVWQGVPYIFTDFIQAWKVREKDISHAADEVRTTSRSYRLYLLYLAFPPMLLLFADKPVWIVVIYSIFGAFFMPFLAIILLYMNNRRSWVGAAKYGWGMNILLILVLALFLYIAGTELYGMIIGG